MERHEKLFILKSFFIWRILLFIPIFLAPYFFKLQNNFLGGGMEKYLSNPYLWSWANFDGEHYLSIAKIGYGGGEQAFFPLYPLLLKIFGEEVWGGLILSNLSLLFALFGMYKLARLDYSEKISKLAIILLLLFPTSFYFAGVYTESLFLALVVWSFYFFRKEKYLLSGILGMFLSATRIIGIVLVYLYVFIKKRINFMLLVPLGLLCYMYYSYVTWGDYLKFFNSASGFGEQRSDHLIMLPQVFYRYFVKIIPNLTWSYFPVVFTTILEITTAVLFLSLIFVSFKKLDIKYWIFFVLAYLIPTLSGSFSSLSRYILVIFPAFFFLAQIVSNLPKLLKLGIYVILSIILLIAQMLFVRGYFVS